MRYTKTKRKNSYKISSSITPLKSIMTGLLGLVEKFIRINNQNIQLAFT